MCGRHTPRRYYIFKWNGHILDNSVLTKCKKSCNLVDVVNVSVWKEVCLVKQPVYNHGLSLSTLSSRSTEFGLSHSLFFSSIVFSSYFTLPILL